IVEEDARRAGWKQGLEEGREKGLEEGRAKGMAEGMKKGMAEGMKKGKSEEKRAIAHNLKALGLTSEQIQAATGLSAREIDLL
uniref:Yae1 family protein n=1 Tax=Phocaeicola barnesiae TaxID=376804 RepID=UPI000367BFFD